MINEDLAKRAKENMSFSDYKPGNATAEYNAVIVEATAKIEKAKTRVSDEGKARLDNLLERYKAQYANWTNKFNANGASHVSVMISGPSGFNHRAHEKYLNREGKLWAEYDDIKDIDSKISAIVTGDKIIKSDDANAIEKLKDKLAKLEARQELMKAANAIVRKNKLSDNEKIEQLVKLPHINEDTARRLLKPDYCGRIGFPSCELTNNNANTRTVKQRIAKLEKIAAVAEVTPQIETEINGIKIIDNLEIQRLQIIFPGKPDADTRNKLKKNGFRWSPTNGAWQSYRNYNAERTAKEIAESLS
jgi:hypothetical protein